MPVGIVVNSVDGATLRAIDSGESLRYTQDVVSSLQLAAGHGAEGALWRVSDEEGMMKPRAPKSITWWIALIIGVVGVVAHLVTIPFLSGYAFWLEVVAFVLLILATALKGL